jgi:hypothetical protein
MNHSNPTVNRCLRDEVFDHMDHALGRPAFPLRESFRNYFATEAGGDLAASFSASHYWAKSGQSGDMAYFRVTQAGRAALVEHLLEIGDEWRAFEVTYRGHTRVLPAKTAGKARYSYFLDLREFLPDLTFAAFAKAVTVRRAS